jgi:NAD(P)-dependent dehydrogenase (short-subunit alcohol dehydrogenase family)
VDVLVNNAGITRDGLFRKMTRDDWDAVIETNLTSLFNVTKQVIDGMVSRGWGPRHQHQLGQRREGPVRTDQLLGSQGRMHGFTMALAQEVAALGVTVNTVSPGYIATDMVRKIRQEVLDKIVAGIPVKRLGTPRRHRLDRVLGGLRRVRLRHRSRLFGERRPAHGLKRLRWAAWDAGRLLCVGGWLQTASAADDCTLSMRRDTAASADVAMSPPHPRISLSLYR